MIDRLPFIVEAIKITFYGSKTMNFNETTEISKKGFIQFDADILYEVIGSYLVNDRVKVVTKIHALNCHEFVEDFVMESFQKNLKNIIVKKIPEAEGHIDICPITKLINED